MMSLHDVYILHIMVTFNILLLQFGDRDPLILAVDLAHEDIALYLLEKAFPTNNSYQVWVAYSDYAN